MLVHCFWLLDSNPGLNSMVVCSLIWFGKDLDLKKKRKLNPQTVAAQPTLSYRPSAAQQAPHPRAARSRRQAGPACQLPPPAAPLPARGRTRVRPGPDRAAVAGPRARASRRPFLSAPPPPVPRRTATLSALSRRRPNPSRAVRRRLGPPPPRAAPFRRRSAAVLLPCGSAVR
jgi:hypothetical protein